MIKFYSTKTNFDYIINYLQNEIIYGGYFAALCSPAFIIFTSYISGINLNMPILSISYLLPLIVYSYDYYRDIDKDISENSKRAIYLKKNTKKYPYLLSFYIILLLILLILFSNSQLISFIIIIITAGILYNVAFKDLTKKIPIFKNIYTALTWAAGGAFFLPLYYSLSIQPVFVIAFITIFLRCINNIIFFDLKDIENDKKEKLKTLPVILGKQTTINILYVLNIISFIPLIIGIYTKIVPLFAIFFVLFGFYSFFYIKKAKTAPPNELEKLSHVLADSEFLLWPLLFVIIKLLI